MVATAARSTKIGRRSVFPGDDVDLHPGDCLDSTEARAAVAAAVDAGVSFVAADPSPPMRASPGGSGGRNSPLGLSG